MRRFFVFLGVVFMTIGSAVRAQEVDSMAPLQKSSWGDAKNADITEDIPEISIDMRGGYRQDFAENAGRFYGDGLYLDINGKISPHFSYSLNQRLASSYYEDNSGFEGTNWLTLTYEVGNEGVFRFIVDVRGSAYLLDLAVCHNNYGIGHRERFLLVVGDVNEGDPDGLLNAFELILHILAQLEVQCAEGLVEKKHAGVRNKRSGDRNALLLTTRKSAYALVFEAL